MALYKKIKGQDTKVANNSVVDHSQLTGRDSYGAHPISAIRKLPEKLTELKSKSKEIEDKAKQISLTDNNDGTLTFKNFEGNTNDVRAGHLVDNETIKEINGHSTLEVIGVKGTFEKDIDGEPTEITRVYDAEDIYDDIESAEGISLEEGQNGTLIFTDYKGDKTTVQGGYLPDDETIKLEEKTSYNEIELTEENFEPNTYYVLVEGQYVPALEYNSEAIYYERVTQDKMVAFALETEKGILPGETIRQIISSQGGYLDSYNFGANPTQENLTEYAIQNIGVGAFRLLGQVSEEVFNSYTYIYILNGTGESISDYVLATTYDSEETYYILNIWDNTRVINLHDDHTWSWDLNSESWSDLGEIGVIADANNDGLHGLVTGSYEDYEVRVDANGQMLVNKLAGDPISETGDVSTDIITDAINELNTNKQTKLVNQENIKSVNGNSLLGSGNIQINTYQPFNPNWTTNTIIKDLLDDVRDDTTAVEGMAYLGEVTCSDLPFSGNAELVIEVAKGSTSINKVIVASLTSGNVAPYYWQYTYWNGGSNYSGWQTFISADNSIPNFDSSISYAISDLVTYEGIFYTCNTAHSGSWNSGHFTQVNLKDLFDSKQDNLTAGNNINITNNQVSAVDVLTTTTETQTFDGSKRLNLYSQHLDLMGNSTQTKFIKFYPGPSGSTHPEIIVGYQKEATYRDDGINANGYLLSYPNKAGTFALTSDIPSVDAQPTENSTNPVSSGGVYTALQGKQDTLTAGDNITITNNVIASSVPQSILDQIDTNAANVTLLERNKQDKDIAYKNLVLDTWVADNTYLDYPYKATVILNEVDSTMYPLATLSLADTTSGNYAPVVESFTNGINFWSKVNTAITVPAVIFSKTSVIDLSYEQNAAGGLTLTITGSNIHETENTSGGITIIAGE